MADYRGADAAQDLELVVSRMMAQMRVCLPGVIDSFDAASQTVTATPAVTMKTMVDGPNYMPLPQLQSVPVVLPYAQGAGYLLTLPIKAGDHCLLVFADRSIDNVAELGGIRPPNMVPNNDTAFTRSHHLSDAICIPGFIPRPDAVPEYSETHIELRDKERKAYISLGPDGVTITDGTAVWKMSGGTVTTDAPGGIAATSQGPISSVTPDIQTVTGENVSIGEDGNRFNGPIHATEDITTDTDVYDGNDTRLGTHTHSGVMTGSSDTDKPNRGT